MDDLLNQLEVKLTKLINQYEAQKQEKQAILVRNAIAIAQIKEMVTRLKSMESAQNE